MSDFSASNDDRRNADRITLEKPWRADVILGKERHELSIINISNVGARIQAGPSDSFSVFSRGHETDINIHQPSGATVNVRASVSWSFRFPEGYVIGVRFLDEIDDRLISEAYSCSTGDNRTESMAN